MKQGSNEAPDIWKMVIQSLLGDVVALWIESGLGFELDTSVNDGVMVRRSVNLSSRWVETEVTTVQVHRGRSCFFLTFMSMNSNGTQEPPIC